MGGTIFLTFSRISRVVWDIFGVSLDICGLFFAGIVVVVEASRE